MPENPPCQPAARPARGLLAALSRPLAIVILAGVLQGWATDGRAEGGYDDDNDPLEGYNRVMFEVNQTIDGLLLKPAAEFYVLVVPEGVRYRISNVLSNLGEPINVVNNLAQGKMEGAGASLMRFTINSTVGVAGFFDVATGWGLERAPEDFGQTLASWGVGDEPYLVLPLLGPSNPRDAVGFGVDWAADPVAYLLPSKASLARSVFSGVSQRAKHLDNLETLERTSVDFYAAIRELYKQYRDNEIRDGAPPATLEVPDFDFDDEFGEDFYEEWPEE